MSKQVRYSISLLADVPVLFLLGVCSTTNRHQATRSSTHAFARVMNYASFIKHSLGFVVNVWFWSLFEIRSHVTQHALELVM